jgi:hypothetical protein
MGGSSKQPTTTTQTSIPEYAKPYVEGMLGQAQKSIYDIGPNNQVLGMRPMQQYTGPGADTNRVAGFNPLQIQAGNSAANMQTNIGGADQMVPQYDLAKQGLRGVYDQAGKASQYDPASFQTGFTQAGPYNPAQFSNQSITDQGTVNKYMDPYMQNVVDIGKREAIRSNAIQNTQQQAQATQSGAFGGSGDALMRAESARNLNQQLGDIQNTGSQAAFQNAQQQFNQEMQQKFATQQAGEQSRQFGTQLGEQSKQFGSGLGLQAQQMGEQSRQYGAGLGLQGLQQQLSAAVAHGQLTQNEAAQRLQAGQQQFEQGMGIAGMQAQFGGIQQQNQQAQIDNAYQNYITAQNFPYKQLGFQSDMLRGLPISNTSVYEAPPSTASQIAGLGTAGIAGLGLYNASRQ